MRWWVLLSVLHHHHAAADVAPWEPAVRESEHHEHPSVRVLHREYYNIFRYGNRNAASHLWASFLLERAPQMSLERLLHFFTGFCAVSGSPVQPGDYTRYLMTLPLVSGGTATGFMYYCCWPCVCDTHDYIRVDTHTVTTSDGESHTLYFAVIGDPCRNSSRVGDGIPLLPEAPEVRCADGKLAGATYSDRGNVIIQAFPLLGSADHAIRPESSYRGLSEAALGSVTPTPGRISVDASSGVRYQNEHEFGPLCVQRAAAGFNSGMGEIFRKVAGMMPVDQCAAALGHALPSNTVGRATAEKDVDPACSREGEKL